VIVSAFTKLPNKLASSMYNSIEVCCVISLGAALSTIAVAPEVKPVIFRFVKRVSSKLSY